MKKEKKFLNDLENKLSGISKKDRNKIIEKYRNIIHEEKSNNRRIVEDIFTIIEFLFIFLLVFIFGHLIF